MSVAAAIVSVLLAVVLVASGVAKLAGVQAVIDKMNSVRFPLERLWILAVLEFAAAAGLVAGLWWWPLGVAAAVGSVAYFVGAVLYHLRAKGGAAPAVGLLVVSVAAVALQSLAA